MLFIGGPADGQDIDVQGDVHWVAIPIGAGPPFQLQADEYHRRQWLGASFFAWQGLTEAQIAAAGQALYSANTALGAFRRARP